MKKAIVWMLLCTLVCVQGMALAKGTEYTLSVKGSTVLQQEADRQIAVLGNDVPHAAIPGESPATGQPWDGEYLPVLVQIGNNTGNAKVNGYAVQAAGIGNRTPWGLQNADVLYEQVLAVGGYTRFVGVFSDCFAQQDTLLQAGPVRSCRNGAVLLLREWQGGLVYGGNYAGEYWDWLMEETQVMQSGAMIDTHSALMPVVGYLLQNVKRPGNYSVDLREARRQIADPYAASPRPFLFQDGGMYGAGYAAAASISLDWGYKYSISHFRYDADTNTYARYCGAGTNPKKWAQFTAYPAAEKRTDADRVPLTFANVIIQRVETVSQNGSKTVHYPQLVGQGNADIFVDGVYVPGYWVRESIDSQTVYYDDQGLELQCNRGKTFIAQLPPEALCVYKPLAE